MSGHTHAGNFRRAADAETDTIEILSTQFFDDIGHTIVAGRARGEGSAKRPRGDVEVIMDNCYISWRQFVKLQKCQDGGTGVVHKSSWFYQQDFFS